jgi:hypothetical protein
MSIAQFRFWPKHLGDHCEGTVCKHPSGDEKKVSDLRTGMHKTKEAAFAAPPIQRRSEWHGALPVWESRSVRSAMGMQTAIHDPV